MPVESFIEAQSVNPTSQLPIRFRLAMIGLGYIPLLHASTVVVLLGIAGVRSSGWLAAMAGAALYLIPPLAARAAGRIDDYPISGEPLGSSAFLRWWYVTQWQILFNRLPVFEETLRIVPSLYSAWLRLWGAKIGSLVYWSPGVRVADRPLLRIGDRVVVGLDAKLYPHFLTKPASGDTKLVLAPISIGDDALVGGCTLLPAGVTVSAGEETPGGRPVPPFTDLIGGRQRRLIRFRKDVE